MKVFRYSSPTVLNEVANKVVPASIRTVYYLLFKILKDFLYSCCPVAEVTLSVKNEAKRQGVLRR